MIERCATTIAAVSTVQPPPVRLDDDEALGIQLDLSAPGEPLVIAFGGLAERGNQPAFEFARFTSRLGAQRALLRDHHRAWYHRGVRGIGDDLPAVEERLREVVAEARPSRVVVVGASAGGFAAMLLGHRIDADVVHAFAPQTFIAPELRRRHREPRWRREVDSLVASGRYDARFGDVVPVLREQPRRTIHHLWYDVVEQEDVVHATHVAGIPSVRLHAFPEGGHHIVRWLRDAGHLDPIVESALAGTDPGRRPGEIEPVLRTRPSATWIARRRWWQVRHRRAGTSG